MGHHSGKHEKSSGIPRHAAVRRAGPPSPTARRHGRKLHQQALPSHWEVRATMRGDQVRFELRPHLVKGIAPYEVVGAYSRGELDDTVLESLLHWFSMVHPDTRRLPVRFINCQPVPCGREVLVLKAA